MFKFYSSFKISVDYFYIFVGLKRIFYISIYSLYTSESVKLTFKLVV